MVVTNVRFDWLFVFDVNKHDKYSATCLIPKGSAMHKKVVDEIEKAKAKGIEKGLFTEAHMKSASFKHCLRDGDEEIETEGRPPHYAGMVFFNANAAEQPGIVGPQREPIMDKNEFYSGCYGHADVNFYPFQHEKGGRGVGAGLNNIMKTKDGERLDGRMSAEDAFSGLEVTDDDLQ